MKNSFFLLVLLCTMVTFNSCQKDEKLDLKSTATIDEPHRAAHRSCGTHEHMEKLLQDPAYQRMHDLKFEKLKNSASLRADCTTPVDIPMAVHFQGITNPDINCLRQLAQSQISILNADFNGTNGDIGNWTAIAGSFPGVSFGEACVSFCLATQNHPSGYGLANGDLAVTVNTTNGDFDANWSGYINIFVQANTGVLGYSPLGGAGNGDGVVIDANAFGSGNGCGTIAPQAPYNLGRTLTHELGHYLLLDHIWGGNGGCNSDDGVNDTPVSTQPYYGCPQVGASSCNSTDMHMNYMDYTNDACMYMFSAGQATRMQGYVTSGLQAVIQNAANVCGTGGGGGGGGNPTCTDGIQNGDETGVDCGGSNCPPCNPPPSGCITPENIQSTVLDANSAEISWDAVTDAIRYRVRHREQGTNQWTTVTATGTSITINGLKASTTYEYRVRTICQGDRSPFSSIATFTTDGTTGGCTDTYLRFELTLDDYPEETTWELVDFDGGVIASGGNYDPSFAGSTITEEFCLIDDCYTFSIYDEYGDGICCDYGDGYYEFYDASNNLVIASDGVFGYREQIDFCTQGPGQRLRDLKVQKTQKVTHKAKKTARTNLQDRPE